MKKLTAILLLVLFLFNLIGYKAWFYYLETRTNQKMQVALDKKDYSEKDLITIKVPLSLPYFTNWNEFEQYNGSIELNGQHYNYVKRKVSNDTLILLCLPNQEQDLVNNTQHDFEKLLGNVHTPAANGKTSNTSALLKLLLVDYRQGTLSYSFSPIASNPISNTLFTESFLTNRSIASPWQPPDTNS